jgi:hypothetical protein
MIPVHEDLRVPYHQQDTEVSCGAACAQMTLSEIGTPLLGQDQLYDDNHHHSLIEPRWLTGPDGLQWTMNNRKPAKFTNRFVPFYLDLEDSICRKIVWTIHHYQVAPIVLVLGTHWIVVRGYKASAAPTSADDLSYSITGFYVNDPTPSLEAATPPPPPHSDRDGCGSGGDRGFANQYVDMAAWHDTYMKPVRNGHWEGKFIALCDPERSADRVGNQAPIVHPYNGDNILTPNQAIASAMSGIQDAGLADRSPWNDNLAAATPGVPVLVQRLEVADSFYYIVPVRSNLNRVAVLSCVDARFGDFRQSATIPAGGDAWVGLNFDAQLAFTEIVGKTITLDDDVTKIIVRKEASSVHPTLVWKPCQESLSPYYPFVMITVGDYRVYIRVDGAVFTKLNDPILGN